MSLKEKFILAVNGKNATDIEEENTLTIQQMREMLSEDDKEHIRNIIGEYEQKQMNKFVEQLKIMSNACYVLSSTIIPTMDSELLKAVYSKNEEDFSIVLDTIDEMITMLDNTKNVI